jgi:hypothetical protein
VTTALRELAAAPSSVRVAALARIEAGRFARHPLFLAGVAALLLVDLFALQGDRQDVLVHPVAPAFFLGVFGLVVAARLTRSTEKAGDAIAVVPVPATTRTLALCLACLVPAGVAALQVTAELLNSAVWPPPPHAWWYGTMPAAHVLAITVGTPILAAYGGPVLGVTVGRWLRLPAAPLVTAVVLCATVALTLGLGEGTGFGDARLHALSPWTIWHNGSGETGGLSTAILLPGSPTWHLCYELLLSGLAIITALLRGTPQRRSLLRIAALLAVGSAATCALAIITGPQKAQRVPRAQCHLACVDHAAVSVRTGFASRIVAGPSWRMPVSAGLSPGRSCGGRA